MTTTKWVVVNSKWCDLIQQEASIMEQRIYPSNMLPDTENYRVIARKCSANVACNLAEVPCDWAYTRPQSDRFELG